MKLWRISNYADLSGTGGLKAGGRWHSKGIPVVYLSEHPALAMLEVLVRFELAPDAVPHTYQLLEIEYNESSGISCLDLDSLPDNWAEDESVTKSIGDGWLASFTSVLLKVPSVVTPHSYNYLFNPRHDFAKYARIVTSRMHPFDPRLL